ncbi:MAG TPA: hypothetical protein DHW45_21540 [Candidatus Latescibacteria bacterium]|nr:hypothetical protein [Candidatus Latescibacterota bacterium]
MVEQINAGLVPTGDSAGPLEGGFVVGLPEFAIGNRVETGDILRCKDVLDNDVTIEIEDEFLFGCHCFGSPDVL